VGLKEFCEDDARKEGGGMKQKRYSEEQIIYALKQVDAGRKGKNSRRP
jgi:hypothetical protein